MKRGLCLLLLSVLLLPASGCAPTTSADRHPPRATTAMATIIPAIDLAADFTLATLDGGSITLSALRGRWVLINFWATWCIPCRDEMPYLSELAHTEGDTLTVLAINMREGPETVAAFVAELGIDLPVLLAPDDATLLAYGVRGLPMSFLVGPDGALVKRIPGIVQPDDLLVIDEQ